MVVKAKIRIGPQHQGHKMSLRAFEFAEVEEGYLYELARGFIVVSEVANYFHGSQIDVLQQYLQVYRHGHEGIIHRILGGSDSKLLMPEWESERHPDLAIYLTKPSGKKDRTMWRTWIPEVVIEVVSPSSVDRDYVEKREEYWTLGAKGILDRGRRHGQSDAIAARQERLDRQGASRRRRDRNQAPARFQNAVPGDF